MAEMCFKLREGRTIGFSEYGHPTGFPIVYFHGGLSSHTDIGFTENEARAKRLRIIAPDRPGIGLSSKQAGWTLKDWSNSIKVLLAELGVSSTVAFGWSAGGVSALACGRYAPEVFTRVITVAGMCPLTVERRISELGLPADRLLLRLSTRAPFLARLLLEVSAKRSDTSLKREFERALGSSDDKAILTAISPDELIGPLRAAIRRGADGIVEDYRVMATAWGFELDDITVPCFFWQGKSDSLLPVSHANILSTAVPNGKLRMIPNAGHFLLRRFFGRVAEDFQSK